MSYFKKKSAIMRVNFGVPYFDVFDKKYSDISVPVAIRGTITFKASNMKKFLSKNGYGTEEYSKFEADVRTTVTNYIKAVICTLPEKYGLPVCKLENMIGLTQDYLSDSIIRNLKKQHKISVLSFNITDIDIDKTSEGFTRLKAITTDAEYKKALALIDADIAKTKATASMPDKSNKGLIAAAVIGGAAVIGIIALIICLLN